MLIALLIVSFLLSAYVTLVLADRAQGRAQAYGLDMPQRFHDGHVPRVGGLGVLAGMAIAWCLAAWLPRGAMELRWSVPVAMATLACLLPAVVGAAVEDVTQRVPVRWRLGLTLASAALLCWVLDLRIERLGVPTVDAWLSAAPLLAMLLAVVAVGGLSHAFNLIDGYNGLAGSVAVLICGALAYVALQVGDLQLATMTLCLAGATLGFLLWNYPRGDIFAGDSGAYLWGLVIAAVSILLVQRHETISPWFPALLLVYPVWETLFSMFRKLARGQSPCTADALHLHQLIFRRIVRRVPRGADARGQLLSRNNRTSPLLWAVNALAVVPAVLFRGDTAVLMALTALFIVGYVAAYIAIVRFKVPRWMRM